MERFLRDFGLFLFKGLFQSFFIIVSSSAGFPLQDESHTKVQRVQVRRWRGPQILLPKRKKVTLTPILRLVFRVRRRTILLKGEWPFLEVFLHLGMSRSQNIVDIRICVDFSAFNENERRFSTLRDGSPNHNQRRVLATENTSRMWGYCPHSLQNFCRSASWVWPQQWTFSRQKRWFHQPACLPSLHSRESSIFPTSIASAMPLVVFCLSFLTGATWGIP